jgi:hypothetical protein
MYKGFYPQESHYLKLIGTPLEIAVWVIRKMYNGCLAAPRARSQVTVIDLQWEGSA